MNSTIEHGRKALRVQNRHQAQPTLAMERMHRRLEGHVRRLSRRVEKYDVRLKAIEFKLNFIWAVTVMLLALALGIVGQALMKGVGT